MRRAQAAAHKAERQRRLRAERAVRELKKAVAAQKRNARDLVDTVLQGLYAIGLGLEATRTMLTVNPQRASQALVRAAQQLNDLIQRLRAYLAPRTT